MLFLVLFQQLSQHVLQNAAMLVVLQLDFGVEADDHVERFVVRLFDG